MPIENEKLIEQAEELELDVEDFDSEDELKEAIDEKLKLESGGDDDDDDPEKLKEKVDFLDAEAKKAFKARDRAKKDARKLKSKMDEQDKELKSLKKALEDSPSAEEYQSIKERLEEIENEREEKRLAKMDDTEKQKVRFDKKLKEFEEKLEATESSFSRQLQEREKELTKSKKEIETLRKARLGGEIIREAAKLNAYKPEQIEKLLLGDFIYDDQLETYTYIERDGKGKIVDELTVEERVKQFLEDPDNDNLVRGTSKGGIGSKEQGTNNSSKATEKTGKKDEHSNLLGGARLRIPGQYDPKDPALKAEADEKGLSVEDLIEILKVRDAKMNKIKGIKEDK